MGGVQECARARVVPDCPWGRARVCGKPSLPSRSAGRGWCRSTRRRSPAFMALAPGENFHGCASKLLPGSFRTLGDVGVRRALLAGTLMRFLGGARVVWEVLPTLF